MHDGEQRATAALGNTDYTVEEWEATVLGYSALACTVVVLMHDTPPGTAAPGMRVMAASQAASYGHKAGGVVAFNSHAKHEGLPVTKEAGHIHKLSFFLRHAEATRGGTRGRET